MKVICNTTPLIALASIKLLGLLHDVYGKINIPQAVFDEINHGGPIDVPGLSTLKWVEIIPDIQSFENKLLFQLDSGEQQVILHGLKDETDLILIDDKVARNTAEYLGLRVKGTLGVLVEGRRRNLISSFRECALRMRDKGIYFSKKLIAEIDAQL